jgi:hypothetical protein
MTHPLIRPHHLQRTAYVYLRQSRPGQVRRNREGHPRQQGLVEHVTTRGWPRPQSVLLDGDTGQTGSAPQGRFDFPLLLEALVTGKAGLVAGRELSRLVRDNQDGTHVVRRCRVEDVLLADERRLDNAADAQDGREEWEVFLEKHHEAALPQGTWERNMEEVAANANVCSDLTKGAVGRGQSLMAARLRCRRCGNHRRQRHYPSRGVRGVCSSGTRPRMRSGAKGVTFHGAEEAALLAEEILEVVGPAGVEAVRRAAEHWAGQYQQQRQLLVDRWDAAREAEARAAREYKPTGVTYTAVRHALGGEWETALTRVAEEGSRGAAFDERQPVLPTPSPLPQRVRLGADVRRLWNHPRAANRLKQPWGRVLLRERVAHVDEDRDAALLLLPWSGHHPERRGRRTLRRGQGPAGERKSLVAMLRKVQADGASTSVLNRRGLRTTHDETWTAERVRRYRQRTERSVAVPLSGRPFPRGWSPPIAGARCPAAGRPPPIGPRCSNSSVGGSPLRRRTCKARRLQGTSGPGPLPLVRRRP